MIEDIEIEYGRGRIGSISIVRNPNHLHGVRTASGFELQVPIVLNLRCRPKDEPVLLVERLRGRVFVKVNGDSIGVGRLEGDSSRSAGISSGESYDYKTDTHLKWTGTLADLAYIEKYRNGDVPKLQMEVEGEWCFLLPVVEEVTEDKWNQLSEREQRRLQQYSHFRVRTDSQRIYSRMGSIDVAYPREIWIAMIRKLGIAENVFLEVPLPPSPRDPWNSVWKALVDARNAFEQGGSTGWQATITSVRLALERWRDIEPENQGAGWVRPSRTDLESRTKKQRLDALRWHLMQAAHLGPHTGAEEWSRDDALLMFSTLSVLLAERKP
jgi:hypothetical protein